MASMCLPCPHPYRKQYQSLRPCILALTLQNGWVCTESRECKIWIDVDNVQAVLRSRLCEPCACTRT